LLAQAEIVGSVYLAHSASAQQSDDSISAGNQNAWGEAPLVSEVGGASRRGWCTGRLRRGGLHGGDFRSQSYRYFRRKGFPAKSAERRRLCDLRFARGALLHGQFLETGMPSILTEDLNLPVNVREVQWIEAKSLSLVILNNL
jgi:hypothetical protein